MTIDKTIAKAVGNVLATLEATNAHTATAFLSPALAVRATRRLERGRVPKARKFEASLTIGKPNYRGREFVKKCQKAGEPFPVKRMLLSFPAKKR